MPEHINDGPSPRIRALRDAKHWMTGSLLTASDRRSRIASSATCAMACPRSAARRGRITKQALAARGCWWSIATQASGIRINATTEIVILEIAPDVVTIAVETAPAAAER